MVNFNYVAVIIVSVAVTAFWLGMQMNEAADCYSRFAGL